MYILYSLLFNAIIDVYRAHYLCCASQQDNIITGNFVILGLTLNVCTTITTTCELDLNATQQMTYASI